MALNSLSNVYVIEADELNGQMYATKKTSSDMLRLTLSDESGYFNINDECVFLPIDNDGNLVINSKNQESDNLLPFEIDRPLPDNASLVIFDDSTESGGNIKTTDLVLNPNHINKQSSCIDKSTYTAKVVNKNKKHGSSTYTKWSHNKLNAPIPKTTETIYINSKDFKKQLIDTSDTLSHLTLLPHTKKLMNVFSWNYNDSMKIPLNTVHSKLNKLYERNCIVGKEENDIEVSELHLMPYGYKRPIDLSQVKRIIRKRKNPSQYLTTPVTDEYVYLTEIVTDCTNDGIYETSETECQESTDCIETVQLSDESGKYYICEPLKEEIHNTYEIIQVDGNEDVTYTHQNIDVLLAAVNSNSIIFSQSNHDYL